MRRDGGKEEEVRNRVRSKDIGSCTCLYKVVGERGLGMKLRTCGRSRGRERGKEGGREREGEREEGRKETVSY